MAFFFGRKRKRSHDQDQDQDHESGRGDPAMSTSSAILQNHSYGLKVLEEPQNAAGVVFDIVFVHGLRGSIETTWRHNRTGAYWPRDFLSKDLSNCRIFAFGYDADIVNLWNPASKNRISNHAGNLIGALAGEREITDTNSRKIIFIGHSLGGLVIQQALCHSKNSVEEHIQKIHECTAAIMFLGTPHFGADMAKWAAFGSHMADSFKRTNSDIVNVLKPGSEMLANIQGNFHSILRTREKSDQHIQITCFYEELALSYVGEVVPMHSATLPSYPSYGIHANHMDMTKFPSCDDAGYGSIRRELLRWTKQLSTAGPTRLALNSLSVKDSEDLQSFYTCDYEYHKSLIPLPVPGTCTWIVQHPKYKAWNAEAQSSILWMSADPGWGKSVLASFLVEELRGDSRTPHEVCYFFFNDNDEDRDNSTSMIRSILHQLFTAQPHLLKCAAPQKTTKGQKFLSQFNALWQIFLSAVMDPACANLVLVIDGMDECNLSSRDQFFDALRKVSSDATISTCSSPVLKIFITSRPLESFRSRTFKLPTIFWQVEEEMELINDDISLVVRDRVRKLAARRRLSQDFEDRLAEKLIGSADHTFLWVTLVLEMLERSTNASENALNKIIDTLPTNLDGLYTKLLTQSSDIQMARKILHIVVAAFRPLNLMEINIALAIQPEHDTVEKLRKSLDPSIDYAIREACGPFIRVNNSKVNLVHQTAKAFLVQEMDCSPAQTNSWKHSLLPNDSNKILVDACMMYLTLEDFKKDQLLVLLRPSDSDDSDSSESYSSSKSESFDRSLPWIDPEEERTERVIMNYIRRYDFLEYAARYWPAHFRQSGAPSSLNGQVYTLCNEYGSYVVFYNWFYVYARFSSTWNYEIPHCLPELMVASYFGFEVQVQKLLMEDPISINRTDQMGWTALMYAAVGGHENVIAILLKAGANVNAFGESYHSILREDHSALIVASAHGHDRLVQIFLDHGAQTSTQTESAVSTAAAIGNLDVIRVLLRNGFDIEQQDVEGQTPLHHACLNGRLETFQFLVQEGASIFAKDRRGRCALDMAAEAGALEIVRILLDRGMDVNGADKYGTTAVDLADEFGNHEVLRSLLEHGAEDLWGGKFPTPESPPKENSKEPYTHRLQHFHLNKQDLLGQLPWVFKKILYRQEKTWKPDEFLPSPEEFSQEYARKWKEIVKVHKEIENRK